MKICFFGNYDRNYSSNQIFLRGFVQAGATVIEVGVHTPITPLNQTGHVSLAVVFVLILLLSVDLAVVSHRKVARVAGRTFAHLAFFGMVLTILVILKAGQIL